MYYNRRKLFVSIMWILIGAALLILDIAGIIDNPIYSGMGGGFFAIGIMQVYKNLKYHANAEYKEKLDIELTDERNRYLRMKAWSWAGYLFILGAGVVSIVLFLCRRTVFGQTVCYCMCAVLLLYWISYTVLQKKE